MLTSQLRGTSELNTYSFPSRSSSEPWVDRISPRPSCSSNSSLPSCRRELLRFYHRSLPEIHVSPRRFLSFGFLFFLRPLTPFFFSLATMSTSSSEPKTLPTHGFLPRKLTLTASLEPPFGPSSRLMEEPTPTLSVSRVCRPFRRQNHLLTPSSFTFAVVGCGVEVTFEAIVSRACPRVSPSLETHRSPLPFFSSSSALPLFSGRKAFEFDSSTSPISFVSLFPLRTAHSRERI